MNVIFTCGGTGGHINPALAVANVWKEKYPDSNILFVGGIDGMEEQLVPKAGYKLIALEAHGVRRGKNIKSMLENVMVVWTTWQSYRKCRKIIKDFKPDVIVGTGGYASFPMLTAGANMGIPTCVHEANAMPGLTTRMVADKADRVLVCFPQSVEHYKNPEKVEVVGMPVRREFIYTKKAAARRELGIPEDVPLVVSAFGSQGAKAMNEAVGKLFKLEQDANCPFRHIHAIGSYGMEWMPDYVKAQGVDLEKNPAITMQEYIYNMPTVMAAADVFISRAGASSCNEIAVSGTPCILIPSPNVTDNHQEKNARALADKGGAVLILEKDCTAKRLMEELTGILENKERYSAMRQALLEMSVPDCAERLCTIMESLIRK